MWNAFTADFVRIRGPGWRMLVGAVLLAALAWSVPAHGQAIPTFILSPQRIELRLEPSADELTGTITLRNTSTTIEHISLDVIPWYQVDRMPVTLVDDWGGLPQEIADWLKPHVLSPYIELTPKEFDLEANAERTVQYSVSHPSKTGGYWAAITATAYGPSAQSAGAVSVNVGLRNVSVVYLNVVPATASVGITDLRGKLTAKSAEVSLSVKANGDLPMATKVSLFITDSANNAVANLMEPRFLVLPGATRTLARKLDVNLPPGAYMLWAVVEYGADSPLVARVSDLRVTE